MQATEHRVLQQAVRWHRVPECAGDQALGAPSHTGLSTKCSNYAGHWAPSPHHLPGGTGRVHWALSEPSTVPGHQVRR